MRPFHAYLLRCSDGSYYAGHTDDLATRMQQHADGLVGYTSTRKPQELVWQGEFETREGALAFELQIKGWSRAKKEALIAGAWDEVSRLAKSSQAPLRQAQDRLRQAQGERGGVTRLGDSDTQRDPRQAQGERGGATYGGRR